MFSTAWARLCLGLFFGGSAAAAPERLRFEAGDVSVVAPASGTSWAGEGVSISWRDGRLSGVWHGRQVELRADGSGVRGRLGEWPVAVRRVEGDAPRGRDVADEGVELRGRLAQQRVELNVTEQQVNGRLGGCSYALSREDGAYRGWRDCLPGGAPEQVELELPGAAGAPLASALMLVALAPARVERPPAPGAGHRLLLEERFGLQVGEVPPGFAGGGARVVRVLPRTAAADAGLVAGMVIDAAGGRRIENAAALEAALAALQPGETLELRHRWPGRAVWTRTAVEAPLLFW